MKPAMLYKLVILIGILITGVADAAAHTIIVHPSLKVKNISQALQQAHNGDTILVKQGRYAVANLGIDKSVTLLGEGYPVLDGQMKGDVLIVNVNHVIIKGFHICNTNKGSLRNYAGIRCESVKNIIIENNRFNNTLFPVYLPKTSHSVVRNNVINGSSHENTTAMESGSGIYLWYASDILVDGNSVSGQRDGIYFEFSNGCTVSNNRCKNNYRYGLHFMFSDSNTYIKNIFSDNGAGVAVMYSGHIIMLQNRFEYNWGPAAYGLLLKEINDSRISDNIFGHNTTGIYMESCSRNQFSGNNFNMNGWALNILSDCTGNRFDHNNFTGNTFDVSTNGSPEQNSFDANYWDKYAGYDLNKDGIGDIPYYPVSLYSKIVENIPYAITLFRSFVVSLLDKAERAIPSLIPVSVIDHHPLMQQYQKS
jgi:nitrous oxidase accessory protein